MSLFIVIYARVSTTGQKEEGHSLGEQLRLCRERAAQIEAESGQPATIVEFQDDMSGSLIERPGLQAALELVRNKTATHFICLDPDRLARKLMLQLLVTDEIEKAGVALEFVQHDYKDTPEGRLFYQMRGAFAEFERMKIRERSMRGAKAKIHAGGLRAPSRRYGYDYIPGLGKVPAREALTVNPTEARWVLAMFQWCAEEALGPVAIARRLTELGVPTKTGKTYWSHNTVRRIIRDEAYATGRMAVNTQDTIGKKEARRLSPEERRRRGISLYARPKPRSEWVYVEIDPIVPVELYRKAQQVIAGFRIGERGHTPRIKMLTGLGRCGICGDRLMYLGAVISCQSRHRRYFQQDYQDHQGCGLLSKRAKHIEAAVWGTVRQWVLDPDALRSALDAASTAEPVAVADPSEEISTLEQHLKAKTAEQERLGLLYARGLMPAERALALLEEVTAEIERAKSRLAALRAAEPNQPTVEGAAALSLLSNADWLAEARKTIETATERQKIELVRLLVGEFVVHQSGWRQPPIVSVYPRTQPLTM